MRIQRQVVREQVDVVREQQRQALLQPAGHPAVLAAPEQPVVHEHGVGPRRDRRLDQRAAGGHAGNDAPDRRPALDLQAVGSVILEPLGLEQVVESVQDAAVRWAWEIRVSGKPDCRPSMRVRVLPHGDAAQRGRIIISFAARGGSSHECPGTGDLEHGARCHRGRRAGAPGGPRRAAQPRARRRALPITSPCSCWSLILSGVAGQLWPALEGRRLHYAQVLAGPVCVGLSNFWISGWLKAAQRDRLMSWGLRASSLLLPVDRPGLPGPAGGAAAPRGRGAFAGGERHDAVADGARLADGRPARARDGRRMPADVARHRRHARDRDEPARCRCGRTRPWRCVPRRATG